LAWIIKDTGQSEARCQIKNESQNRYRAKVKTVDWGLAEMLGIISVDTIGTIINPLPRNKSRLKEER
jgi:hypothetical protein